MDFDRLVYLFNFVVAKLIFKIKWKWRFKFVGAGSFWIRPARILGVNKITLGRNVRILHHARLEVHTYSDTEASLKIGDSVEIGHNFFCTCMDTIEIGKECLFSDNVAIIDNAHTYEKNEAPSQTDMVGRPVKIGDHVTLYRNVTILSGVTIGTGAVVAAGSVVKHDVPPFCMVAGAPATLKKRL